MTETEQDKQNLDLLPMDVLTEAAACLKVMAHPVRLRIVDVLMQGEFAVHKIADMCGIKQHQVCEHLRLMQSCGFLSSRRDGRTVYYSIESNHLPALIGCIRSNCG
ncbi:MAG: ArsR/SmtB family transcription factor [Armatimonadota bacterium]